MTSTAVQSQPSWIRSHLTGYMVFVYAIDLALVGTLFARPNFPFVVSDIYIYDVIVFINLFPPVYWAFKWIRSKCVGPYWPIKTSSTVGLVGIYLLFFGILGAMHAEEIKPSVYARSVSPYAVTPQSSPDDIMRAFKLYNDENHIQYIPVDVASADPVAYLNGHPWLFDYASRYFLVDSSDITDTIQKSQMYDQAVSVANTVGAYGFTFIVGSIVGSIVMAVCIGLKNGWRPCFD